MMMGGAIIIQASDGDVAAVRRRIAMVSSNRDAILSLLPVSCQIELMSVASDTYDV